MNITVTSRHNDMEPAAKEYAHDRLERVVRLFERLDSAQLIVDHEHESYVVEATVTAPKGGHFVARTENRNLRAAIDAVGEKLEAQVRSWKGRLVDHRQGPPAPAPPPPGPPTGGE